MGGVEVVEVIAQLFSSVTELNSQSLSHEVISTSQWEYSILIIARRTDKAANQCLTVANKQY